MPKGTNKSPPLHHLVTLRDVLNIPEEIHSILPEAQDVDDINLQTLEYEVAKKLLCMLSSAYTTFNSDASNEIDKEQVLQTINSCVICLRHIAQSKESATLLHVKFKNILHDLINSKKFDFKIKNIVSQTCEKVIEGSTEFDECDNEWAVAVFLWLLEAVQNSEGKNATPLVKRVASFGRVLARRGVIVPSGHVIKTVTDMKYLNVKEGRQHIAVLMACEAFTMIVHKKIFDMLPTFPASVGPHYGEIYMSAWTKASKQVRMIIELDCIHNLMKTFLRLDRFGAELSIPGKIIFKILWTLHHSRRILEFSAAITKLYIPILWRATKSSHPIERCNAAQLLFDVFPLEKPDESRVENCLFKQKQFKEMIDLLKDECHSCRIVSIRGTVNVITEAVTCLSTDQWRVLIGTLAEDLVNDGSTPLIRKAVFVTLGTSVTASKHSANLLQPVFPLLLNHFHDVNKQVRKEFVHMLLKIQESDNIDISYTEITPIPHVVARLALEDKEVGELLSKLVMPKFYTDGMNLKNMIARLQKLILMNQKAAENLFKYSYASLSVEQIHVVILGILAHLRLVVKGKLGLSESVKENDNQDPVNALTKSPTKKKKRIGIGLSPPNEMDEDQNVSQVTQVSNEREEPDEQLIECHTGLLVCVQVAWLAFHKQLTAEGNEKLLSNLYQMTVKSLQSFLRFYKGTPAFYATIGFSALVPVGKLVPETTVTSSCLSELKNAELDTPKNVIEILIYSLCSWNRGHEIIELAIDWIDPAFKHFKLNQSAIHELKGNRKIKVRFQKTSGRHILGVRILRILFSDYVNEKRLLLKHHNAVIDLFSYLEQIKIIIDTKFATRKIPDIFSPEFLSETISLVYQLSFTLDSWCNSGNSDERLAPHLRRESPPKVLLSDQEPQSEAHESDEGDLFSATSVLIQFIEWANKVILPALPEFPEDPNDIDTMSDEDKLPLVLLSDLLKAVNESIKMDICSELYCKAGLMFVMKLLMIDWKLYFINDSFALIRTVCEYSEPWLRKDEWEIFSSLLPSIYSYCLSALNVPYQNLFSKLSVDMKALKKDILFLPQTALRMFGKESSRFIQPTCEIFKTAVTAILKDSFQNQMLEVRNELKEHPFPVDLLMTALLSKESLRNIVLTVINSTIDECKDQMVVVSIISLLFTLVNRNTKSVFNKADLQYTVNLLRNKLCSFKEAVMDDSFDRPLDLKTEALELLEKTAQLSGFSVEKVDRRASLARFCADDLDEVENGD